MKRTISRQRRYQMRHYAKGLCLLCPKKAVNATHCETHRRSVNVHCREYNREYHDWQDRYPNAESYQFG